MPLLVTNQDCTGTLCKKELDGVSIILMFLLLISETSLLKYSGSLSSSLALLQCTH
jgi:hypothetical protein